MAGLNASVMFAEGITRLGNGSIDWDTSTMRAILVKTSYANTTLTETAKDTHNFIDDVPTATDRSKAVPGEIIATADIVINTTNDKVNYGSGTVSLSFATVADTTPCRGIVVYKSSSATEAECPILCYCHFSAVVTADGGTVQVNLNADGVFRASY